MKQTLVEQSGGSYTKQDDYPVTIMHTILYNIQPAQLHTVC